MKFRAAILVTSLLLCASCVLGQSCAMCYGSAKSTTKEGQRAINKAVLVLLIPPVSCLTFGVWLAFRYSKRRDFENDLLLGFADADGADELRKQANFPICLYPRRARFRPAKCRQ